MFLGNQNENSNQNVVTQPDTEVLSGFIKSAFWPIIILIVLAIVVAYVIFKRSKKEILQKSEENKSFTNDHSFGRMMNLIKNLKSRGANLDEDFVIELTDLVNKISTEEFDALSTLINSMMAKNSRGEENLTPERVERLYEVVRQLQSKKNNR